MSHALSHTLAGGHTSEMIRFLKTLDIAKHSPRVYVVANTDKHSAQIATNFELHTVTQGSMVGSFIAANMQYNIRYIPRSREVGQSYFTSIFTTLVSLWSSLLLMLSERPDLVPFLLSWAIPTLTISPQVLTNGPGTCVPICFIAILMKTFGIHPSRTVLLESYACVNHLSATAKILNRFVDVFGVQWPQLKKICPRATYTGRLPLPGGNIAETRRSSPRKSRKSLRSFQIWIYFFAFCILLVI